jgi:protein translocase SecG subunit
VIGFPTFLAAASAAPVGLPLAAGKAAVPGTAATLSPALLQQIQNLQTHKSVLATNLPWLTHTFAALFVLCAVALVFLLAIQTTKQEGLTGTIGGRVESNYRPRLGFDQQLSRITSVVAIGFVFFAVVVSISGI